MPVFSDVSSEYLESMEIQTVMCLLKIIDNPMQDIPLVTVLRSSIGGFTDNELVEIRGNDKNISFYESLNNKYNCLINKNKEENIDLKNKTLILMTDDIYSENYKKGDLVVVEKRGFSRTGGYTDVIEQGDEIFAIRVDAYGNAYVEEIWDAYVNEGTEGWHPHRFFPKAQ